MSYGGGVTRRRATLTAAVVSAAMLATIVLAVLALTPSATVGVRIANMRLTAKIVFPRTEVREDGYIDGKQMLLRIPATRHVSASPAKSLVSFSYSILEDPFGGSPALLSRPVIPIGTAVTMCERDFPADRCKGRRFTFHTLRDARLSVDCILNVLSLSECSAPVPVVADVLGPAANIDVPFATTKVRVRLADGTPVKVSVDAGYIAEGGADAHLAVDPSVRGQALKNFWRDVQRRIGTRRVLVGSYGARTEVDQHGEMNSLAAYFVDRPIFVRAAAGALSKAVPAGMRLLTSTLRAEPIMFSQLFDRSLVVTIAGDAASVDEQELAALFGNRSRADAQQHARHVGSALVWIREPWTPRRRLPPPSRLRVRILNPA